MAGTSSSLSGFAGQGTKWKKKKIEKEKIT